MKGDFASPNQKIGDTRTPKKFNTSQPDRVHYHYSPIDAEATVRDALEKASGRTVVAGKWPILSSVEPAAHLAHSLLRQSYDRQHTTRGLPRREQRRDARSPRRCSRTAANLWGISACFVWTQIEKNGLRALKATTMPKRGMDTGKR